MTQNRCGPRLRWDH